MGHVYNLKKQFKVQINGILEEIDSFSGQKCTYEKVPKNLGRAPPTVGQEAVESICQSERKTQQNAKISLWPLFSTEMDLILM